MRTEGTAPPLRASLLQTPENLVVLHLSVLKECSKGFILLLKTPHELMTADGLLSVTPEALAKAISGAAKQRDPRSRKSWKKGQRKTTEPTLASESKAQLKSVDTGTEEHAKVTAAYEENETFRRRTASRLQVVKNAVADQDEAVAFWQDMLENGAGALLEDAERVRNGGRSSFAPRQSKRR